MLIADTNEFHALADGAAYAAGRAPDGSPYQVVILRATYSSWHVDNAYTSSLAQARAGRLLVGHYGYLVAGEDAAAQGTFFGQIVKADGGLRPGDQVWCDCEEGSGDQAPRVEAFLAAAHTVLGDPAQDEGVYSGQAFWAAHLGQLPSGPHRWIAAYSQSARPAGAELWQFTDNRPMPGVQGPCDCSIYTGSLDQFRASFGYQPVVAPPPAPFVPGPPIGEDMIRQTDLDNLPTVQIRQGWDNWIAPPPGVNAGRVIECVFVANPLTPVPRRKSYSGPTADHPDGRINLDVTGVPDGVYLYILTWIDTAAAS